jgi:outer membrane murein-binding lipoprotein Lpp
MAAIATVGNFPYAREMNDLFYRFRLAQLNARYHTARLGSFETADRALQAVIALATGGAFAVLAFSEFAKGNGGDTIKLWAAILSVVAFLAATVPPWFGLNIKMNEARTAVFAWNAAALQLESAMRHVRAAKVSDGCVDVWVQAADASYRAAAALPSTEDPNPKLVKKLSDEINAAFPKDYPWKAL